MYRRRHYIGIYRTASLEHITSLESLEDITSREEVSHLSSQPHALLASRARSTSLHQGCQPLHTRTHIVASEDFRLRSDLKAPVSQEAHPDVDLSILARCQLADWDAIRHPIVDEVLGWWQAEVECA